MKKSFTSVLVSVSFILCLVGTMPANSSSMTIFSTSTTDDDDRGEEVKKTKSELYAEKMPEKRSAGKGVAPKETMARQLARLDARANFAEAISSSVISASKETDCDLTQYAGDDEEGMSVDDAGGRAKTFKQSITEEVIRNTVEVMKNTFFNKRTHKYTVYVCLEYNGEVSNLIDQVVKKVRQKVSDKDRRRIEANLDQFEQEIEKKLKNRIKESEDNE